MKNEVHPIRTLTGRVVTASVMAMTAFLAGCSGASDASSVEQSARVPHPADESLEIEWDGPRALSVQTESGDTVRFSNREAAVGDKLIVQTSDGKIEVHRKPNVLMNTIDALPHLYLKEGTLEQLVTEGFLGEPYVDADQQTLYWSAMKCVNPDCKSQAMGTPERPYLFINRRPGIWLNTDGRVESARSMPASLDQPCPLCGRKDTVRNYVLPETIRRREELTTELASARDARDRAANK